MNGNVSFACPSGLVIANFSFADFGQPYGSPGNCSSYESNPYCTTPGIAAILTAQCAGQSMCIVNVNAPSYQPLDVMDGGGGNCTLSPYIYYQFTCGLPAGPTPTPTQSQTPALIASTPGFATTAGGYVAYIVCGQGTVITDVTFVSYGTPGGDPSYPVTWRNNSFCSSTSALSRVSARCLGLTGCGFIANDDELGVPSGG